MNHLEIKAGQKFMLKQNCEATKRTFGVNHLMKRLEGTEVIIEKKGYNPRLKSHFVHASNWAWHIDDLIPIGNNAPDVKKNIFEFSIENLVCKTEQK